MKILVTNYTFDASAQTVTFGDYASISLDSVLLITNVTDNVIIYNFADAAKGGSVATNVLTLTYDTTSMSDTDNLQIFYADPAKDLVQYTDLDTDSTPAGTVAMYADNGDNSVKAVSTNNPMPVDVANFSFGSGVDVRISDAGGNALSSTSGALDVNLKAGGTDISASGSSLDVNVTNVTSVGGEVASGNTDSGNPVKIGGKYNSTKPTYTDGQRGDLQIGTRGSLSTTLYANDSNTAISSEVDNADGVAESSAINNLSTVARSTMYNGTSWDRVRGDTTNGLDVDVTRVGGNVTVVQGTATNLKTQAENYQGGTAVGSGNPLQVTLANTGANATAVKVDNSAVTQPISAASLPLPTGAATAAKQPALGTAGTASSDVITVQGITSMTPIKTDGSATTQPVSGTFWQTTQPVSLASVPSHAVTNAGTFAVQESGSALTALQLIDDPVFADDAAYTLSTSKGNVLAGVAVETDGTDPGSVSAENDAAAVRTDRNRRMLVNKAHPNAWTANDNQSTAQTNTVLKSAPGASLSLYITDVIVSNGATAGDIRIVEDPGGTPVIKVPKIYVAVTGGAVMHFETPIRITANKAIGYTSTTVTTHSVMVNGYTAP